MILIDSLYINSFGGETILKLIINKLSETERKKIYFIFDKRLNASVYSNLFKANYSVLAPSTTVRLSFYLKNQDRFKTFVCLGNIPPPLKIKKRKVIIFFHNELFLDPLLTNLSFNKRIYNCLKKLYILLLNESNYIWFVQTELIKRRFNKSFKVVNDNILVAPIFKTERKHYLKSHKFSFVYVSSFEAHKNHDYLIQAFIRAAKLSKQFFLLHLTIKNDDLQELIIPQNLEIIFHGMVNEIKVNELYEKSTFAIFPSLNESFGLPLIESVNHNCKVIASDLPYVHEIIQPSLTFDPYSVESISNSIIKAVSVNLPKTKILIENKLVNFINYSINQDV